MPVIADLESSADAHNVINTGTSWTNPASWEQKLGNAGKFIAVSLASGANSFYNSGVAVGNIFGANLQERDTEQWIRTLDNNLGTYYEANKETADLVGFVAGSIIPGLGGVKLFNMGQNVLRTGIQTGKISGTTARITGLLVTNKAQYLDEAAATINQSLASAKIMNAKTAMALGSGFYQNALEAMAGEILITATMFKSPILDDLTATQLAKNMLIGAGLGGTIGGAIDAAKSFGFLRRAMDVEDVSRLGFLRRAQPVSATPASEKIIELAWDAENATMPVLLRSGDAATQTVNETNYQNGLKLFNSRIDKTQNDIRASFNRLSGSDTELGNLVASVMAPVRNGDGSLQAGFSQTYLETLSGVAHIAKVSKDTILEEAARKAARAGAEPDVPVALRFTKLTGERAGEITEEMPRVLGLGDKYDGVKAINAAVNAEKFTLKQSLDLAMLVQDNGHLLAQKRYIWADRLDKIPPGTVIHANDIPLLERARALGTLDIRITRGEGPSMEVLVPTTKQELDSLIAESKIDVAVAIQKTRGSKKGVDAGEEAARIANVRLSYLQGTHSADVTKDLYARQGFHQEHLERLAARGQSVTEAEAANPMFMPTTAKMVYKVDRNLVEMHENIVDAVTYLKQQQQVYVESNRRVTAKWLGNQYRMQLPDFLESELGRTNRRGAGAGLLTGANSTYGHPGSVSTQIGKVTAELEQAWVKESNDAMVAPLTKLGSKVEAAFEFEATNQKLARSDKMFVRAQNSLGEEGLVDMAVMRPKGVKAEEWPEFADYELLNDTNWIPFKHKETADVWDAWVGQTTKRTEMQNEIQAARGRENGKHLGVARPIRPNPRDYPYIAFVKDPRVTNSNHTAMIHAASERELADLIDKVPEHFKVSVDSEVAGRIKVRTKIDVEDYKRARQEYEFSRTLHENYIDHELKSKGVYSNYFPKSDPQKIIDDVLKQNSAETRVGVKELIRLHYEPEFSMFEDLGKEYTRYATSKLASSSKILEETSDNPYLNYVRTALNISNINESHLVYSVNKLLDEAASRAYGAVANAWKQVRNKDDLGKINELLDQQGMKPAYYDAALHALANHTAPRGVLTQFVRKANSVLSLFTLGLDPFNAINNAIGSNILRMTELGSVTRAIKNGNTELAGELAGLGKIRIPGTDQQMLAPTKLVAKAIDNLVKDGVSGPLKARYRSMGLIKDQTEQLALLVDDFTLRGTESVSELDRRLNTATGRGIELAKKLGDAGQKATGNTLAEETNRFLAANVMDQITNLAIKHGLMDEKTAQAYINTFVNRVEGSIIASQRPLIFQGPIGQAVGLFQRYQFNLLQQMFRYVAEGSRKDMAMVLGLQSTLYGIQSLPAFQFINTHIVGQLSGNTEHRDAYDAAYGIFGTEGADFLMYGIPSNILQANIYSRGDINPRHLTIIPTSIQETPIVQGWGKFFGNIFETVGKLGAGGDAVETIVQGIEHNGISRPLAGFAQVFQAAGTGGQVYSTSKQGSILYQNDLVSWASMVRLAGARPLDEAKVNDQMWRNQVYKAARRESTKSLGEVIKTTMIMGNEPDEEQVESFAAKYASIGGKQERFNTWMLQLYKDANVSQAEQLANGLKSPFSQKIQLLMGGDDPE